MSGIILWKQRLNDSPALPISLLSTRSSASSTGTQILLTHYSTIQHQISCLPSSTGAQITYTLFRHPAPGQQPSTSIVMETGHRNYSQANSQPPSTGQPSAIIIDHENGPLDYLHPMSPSSTRSVIFRHHYETSNGSLTRISRSISAGRATATATAAIVARSKRRRMVA